MQLSEEHVCTLVATPSPGDTRVNAVEESGGRFVDGIYLSDTLVELRYAKNSWSAAEAKVHCVEHDGTFIPASKKRLRASAWPPLWLLSAERVAQMDEVELVLQHERCHDSWNNLLVPLDTIKAKHMLVAEEMKKRNLSHTVYLEGARDALDMAYVKEVRSNAKSS